MASSIPHCKNRFLALPNKELCLWGGGGFRPQIFILRSVDSNWSNIGMVMPRLFFISKENTERFVVCSIYQVHRAKESKSMELQSR